jgi:four helix bundle protein
METSETKAQALQRRFVSFAANVIEISMTLPRTRHGSHISSQLLRSAAAAAANYGEARGAESKSDFIHKLRIVLKELNETAVWLELIIGSSLLARDKLVAIVTENEELCRIVAASIQTAGGFVRA